MVAGVLVVGDFMAEPAVEADSAVGAGLSAALVRAGTGTGSGGRAQGQRADLAEPEAGVRKVEAARRLAGAGDRGWEGHPTRREPMEIGTRLAASAAHARRWLVMMAFAATGGDSEDEVSTGAMVGAEVGAMAALVGDWALAGDGASVGVLSGIGRLTGIARGGTGTAITACRTPMRILTRLTI
jgi:hypothetical protein